MYPKLFRWIVGSAVAISLVGAASIAQASSLTSTQISAIVSLLQSFGASASIVANVQATLSGQATTGANTSCLALTYNLYAGMTDSQSKGEVSQLQSFLGVSPTGYFGPMTQEAVQNWQSSHGVVSSGSPDTTGYGSVGPQTRNSMGCTNVQNTNVGSENSGSAFSPIAQSTYLKDLPTSDPNSPSEGWNMVSFGYFHNGATVFYYHDGAVTMPEADFDTFVILSGSVTDVDRWALDKNAAYFDGQVISGADPYSFHLLDGFGYSADDHAVYWDGAAIPGADVSTFVAGNSTNGGDYGAARDRNQFYCSGQAYPLGSNECSPPM